MRLLPPGKARKTVRCMMGLFSFLWYQPCVNSRIVPSASHLGFKNLPLMSWQIFSSSLRQSICPGIQRFQKRPGKRSHFLCHNHQCDYD
ncbi:hypothetical protein BDZ94DRAFT_1272195 [Collybia nuda]|uniref:Uncharacterized protein n=1 Tax=Collybia nuda TaxID=64659 RepID=A0A9P5XVZ9_9AGAR|nr:hypothetical protein BDZ94DRAFT_1272195 [Collybia nuda]